jgi:hypothetical protein
MNVVNTMKSGISNGFNAIKSTVSNIVNGIKNTISNVFNGIWSTVSGIVNKLKSRIQLQLEPAEDQAAAFLHLRQLLAEPAVHTALFCGLV